MENKGGKETKKHTERRAEADQWKKRNAEAEQQKS